MSIPILSVYDANGNKISIPAIKGEAGTPGDDKLFECTYGVTPYSDVVAAINAGKIPYVKFSNHFFIYGKNQDNEVSFTVAVGAHAYKMQVKASGWGYGGVVYATTDDLSGKADAPIIAQSLPSGGVLAVNTQYYLGTQTAVTITLPDDATVGQEILVVFSSGATACDLTVTDITGFDFEPKENKTSWLKFTCYNSDGDWLVETKEG